MSDKNWERNVAAFHKATGQPVSFVPDMRPDPRLVDMRMALITEEFDETIDALLHLKRPDLTPALRVHYMAEAIDGLADLIYVCLGTGLALGLPVSEVWDEVQRANMDKVSGPVRQDGKRLKPPGWSPPAIERIVRELLAESEFADRSIKG
jgi:predicted HAD superfamily Cof-like phosphohydrolase